MMRRLLSTVGASVASIGLLGAVNTAAAQQAKPPTVEVEDCQVYPASSPGAGDDCPAHAKQTCAGQVTCELPIDSELGGKRKAGADPNSWLKVRLKYKCGPVERVSGPFDQDDHATLILSCLG
jgi:hypothetical protein